MNERASYNSGPSAEMKQLHEGNLTGSLIHDWDTRGFNLGHKGLHTDSTRPIEAALLLLLRVECRFLSFHFFN
jgi:hypothetical protein